MHANKIAQSSTKNASKSIKGEKSYCKNSKVIGLLIVGKRIEFFQKVPNIYNYISQWLLLELALTIKIKHRKFDVCKNPQTEDTR